MKTEELIYFYKGWLTILDPKELKILFEELLVSNSFEILNFVEHHFTPYGYTCLWLLGESHLAVHTFPERKKTFFELCSCNELKLETFKQMMSTKREVI